MTRAQDRVDFLALAGALRERRKRDGVAQRETARQIGVHPSQLRSWELGKRVPSAINFITWTRVLGLFVEVTDAEPDGV